MSLLMEKFGEITNNKFDYIKLSQVIVFAKEKRAEFVFIYPEHLDKEIIIYEDDIKTALKQIIDTELTYTIKLKRSHFDKNIFLPQLFACLADFPTLTSNLESNDILISPDDDGYRIAITIDENLMQYCKTNYLSKKIVEFCKSKYCNNFTVEFKPISLEYPEDDGEADMPKYKIDNEQGRLIKVSEVTQFAGALEEDIARYIKDIVKAESDIILCGTVSNLISLTAKPKKDNDLCRPYYKFKLTDFTSEINCIYFTNKNTIDKLKTLANGDTIIAKGRAELDSFNPDNGMIFKIREIAKCKLPAEFEENKVRRQVANSYHLIFPQPYVEIKQVDLFTTITKHHCEALADQNYCVFDLETTGKSAINNKIIEIGAVKIVNGELAETFSTFVDPQTSIPSMITELTGITDGDVANQPKIDMVLPDFYKFCDGCALVAHNISFDISFLRANGEPLNIYFENELIDTLSIARKKLKGLKNYKLGTVLEHFEISNEGAHRAIYDTIATAKLFVKLSEI